MALTQGAADLLVTVAILISMGFLVLVICMSAADMFDVGLDE